MFSFGKHLKCFLPILFNVQSEWRFWFVCFFDMAVFLNLNSGREGGYEGTSRTCTWAVVWPTVQCSVTANGVKTYDKACDLNS